MSDIGVTIRKNGWLQGKILRDEDLSELVPQTSSPTAPRAGIVISQSCDLTHSSLEAEPHVELIVGHGTEMANDQGRRGNYTYGKNPRRLCLMIQSNNGGNTWYEFSCHDRQLLCRKQLENLQPDQNRFLLADDIESLSKWLCQRYRRAALPDEFNILLHATDKKIKSNQKRLSPHISAIYFTLDPDRDLEAGEKYQINLLATVPEDKLEQFETAKESFDSLIEVYEASGIDTNARILGENQVSIHTLRGMKRWPLDHLSLPGDDHPIPIER